MTPDYICFMRPPDFISVATRRRDVASRSPLNLRKHLLSRGESAAYSISSQIAGSCGTRFISNLQRQVAARDPSRSSRGGRASNPIFQTAESEAARPDRLRGRSSPSLRPAR